MLTIANARVARPDSASSIGQRISMASCAAGTQTVAPVSSVCHSSASFTHRTSRTPTIGGERSTIKLVFTDVTCSAWLVAVTVATYTAPCARVASVEMGGANRRASGDRLRLCQGSLASCLCSETT